ncbi:polysaccharide deacetylase family protein [Bellilinea sp.]
MESVSRRDFLKLMLCLVCYPAIRPFVESACYPPIHWNGNRKISAIAVTFDDCLNYDQLKELESVLDSNPDLQVTFFPTGSGLLSTSSKESEIWKRLFSKGHEIGYHSYSHSQPSSLSYDNTLHEFYEWRRALTKILGEETVIKYARPPFGDISWNFLRLCCNQNLSVVMWSQNWSLVHKNNFLELKSTQNGDIVLFHIRKQDIQNFKDCVPRVRDLGFRMVNLTSLFEEKNTTANPHNKKNNSPELICYTTNSGNSNCIR